MRRRRIIQHGSNTVELITQGSVSLLSTVAFSGDVLLTLDDINGCTGNDRILFREIDDKWEIESVTISEGSLLVYTLAQWFTLACETLESLYAIDCIYGKRDILALDGCFEALKQHCERLNK